MSSYSTYKKSGQTHDGAEKGEVYDEYFHKVTLQRPSAVELNVTSYERRVVLHLKKTNSKENTQYISLSPEEFLALVRNGDMIEEHVQKAENHIVKKYGSLSHQNYASTTTLELPKTTRHRKRAIEVEFSDDAEDENEEEEYQKPKRKLKRADS